jgi:hypothetical protein
MSYTSLFGAFPISARGDSLDPEPNGLVGELHGSSRNGAFFHVLRQLLGCLPASGSLRFLAHEPGPAQHHGTDAQTLWTVLDKASLPAVIGDLDALLTLCQQDAAAVADAVCFGSDYLTATEIRTIVASAKECARVNDETPCGEDGESAEFVFAALVSLRGILRRALTHGERIAVFTWMPD